MRDQVRFLVSEGRLEFVNGGWVASDEACPTFEEMIMNIMIGHTFLKKTFNVEVKHAWHVDTFGHSAVTPELFSRMGFKSIFFSRIDEEDRLNRSLNKALEFEWRPEYQSGFDIESSNHSIMAHVVSGSYQAPCGLHVFTFESKREAIETKFQNKLWDIIANIKGTVDCLIQYSQSFQTNHVLIPAGMDFAYMFADLNYKFLEDVFQAVGGGASTKQIRLKYSTVDEYI